MKLYLSVFGSVLLAFLSCSKAHQPSVQHEMQFGAEVRTVLAQQVSASLNQGQDIGIFAKQAESPVDVTNIVAGINNKRFVTDGNGLFRSEDLSAQYPIGQQIDIIAYHPFRRQLSDYRFDIDLSDQSSQTDLDFMVSTNLSSISNTIQSPQLIFERQLARIHINISGSEDLSMQGLRVALQGMRTRGFYDFREETLSTASNSIQDIQPMITKVGTLSQSLEVTIFPQRVANAQKFLFTLANGREYRWELPTDSIFQGGYRYEYDIVLGGGDEVVNPTPPRIYFETPELPQNTGNTLYITHMMPENTAVRNYSLLYDTDYKMAYWVAYPLHASYLGTSGRSDGWGFDPMINMALQPELFRGFGISNVDRGHQIPSADRTVSVQANVTTFYFSNMTPQHSRLNQGLWANLENRVRTWINRTDTLYVVTGAMATSKSDPVVEFVSDNTGSRMAKPKYYYKAIAARTGNSYETIAYKLDNVQPVNNDFTQHSISVEELERETGLIFFPSIPNLVKQRINLAFWQ